MLICPVSPVFRARLVLSSFNVLSVTGFVTDTFNVLLYVLAPAFIFAFTVADPFFFPLMVIPDLFFLESPMTDLPFDIVHFTLLIFFPDEFFIFTLLLFFTFT